MTLPSVYPQRNYRESKKDESDRKDWQYEVFRMLDRKKRGKEYYALDK